MNKNMTLKYNHEKLGELVINISSGEYLKSNKSLIPATMMVKCKKQDTMTFLFDIYEMFAGNNDIATDIIGEYLVSDNGKLTNEQIANEINARYEKIISKNNSKSNEPIKEGDGISATIALASNPQDPIYKGDIIVKNINGQLSANVESQITREDYRGQGLMTRMLTYDLPNFLKQNAIYKISGEPISLDGVSKSNLYEIYKRVGFEVMPDGTVEKDITPVNEM